jgi:[CysO sulfur-carrier protein]-S-L-cysteine hydrolase
MATDASSPLRMTEDAMQNIIRACRTQIPAEACGFVVAEKDNPTMGTSIRMMPNVHGNPVRNYHMADDQVRAAYAEFDRLEQEPVAVYHSHPVSEPLMSDADRARAADPTLAYLIISFQDGRTKARAYRVRHYIGNTIPYDVPIQVQGKEPLLAKMPRGPWALLPGNYVRISYQRTGKTALSVCVARVLECDSDVVRLDPDHKTAARMIPLERIRSVHVLSEGAGAAGVRERLRIVAADARTLLASTNVGAVPSMLQTLHQAFPAGISITMEEK